MHIQIAKDIIWNLWEPVESQAQSFNLPRRSVFTLDIEFYGPAPIGYLKGREALFNEVYTPLSQAFPVVQRKSYLFFGGEFEGNTWIAATGDFYGAMENDWLGITAAQKEVRLRYGEFYRVANGKICEIRCLFDVLGLAAQAGHPLLPPFEGRADTPPGPMAQNGICRGHQDASETKKTLDLVEAMIGGCNRLDERGLESMGMEAYWHEDMIWHGPWGIGSCYGFKEFQDYAQGPSVASFPDRTGGYHRARFADGMVAGFTGWPSLKGTFSGKPFHGAAPTNRPIGMNIMDFYTRREDRLFENWVLIDLIDAWRQFGIDLMAQLQRKVSIG